MDSLNLPQTLTADQIIQLKELIKINKKVIRKSTIAKYHKTEKGKAALKAATAKYYKKKKKARTLKSLQDKIAQNKLDFEELQLKLIDLDSI